MAPELTVEDDRARLEGSAKVSSIDVKDENLRSICSRPTSSTPSGMPELRFAADGLDLSRPEVTARGEITIKGVTQPVEVTGTVSSPMVDAYGNDRIGIALTATVDRTAFGVSWNNQLPSGEPSLPNDVRIVTDLQFVRSV